MLRITCDTNVVIDALEKARAVAVDLFATARYVVLDVAFSTRHEYELKSHTIGEECDLIARAAPSMLGTAGRYDVTRYGDSDQYASNRTADGPALLPSSWRLDYSRLGFDMVLAGGIGEVATPTMDGDGRLQAIDSDHFEAHRLDRRDVFVTSDVNLLKAARERGFDAATPEELMQRIGGSTR